MNKGTLWSRNFLLITLVNFFLYFAFQLFPTALPPYVKFLGASDALVGWLQGILTVAVLLVRPFAGIALDRYGRKGIFLAGIAGMILVTASYHFFQVVAMILVIRFLHGLVWGVSNTACTTVATDNIEKSRFAEGMGYFSLTNGIGMALAPAAALSIGMGNSVSLGVVFLLLGGILALMLVYETRPEVQPGQKPSFAPYAREALLPTVVIFFIMITWGAVITFLALYGQERSIANMGSFFTVYAVSQLISRPFLGKLVDRKGFGAGLWPGVILSPAALVLLSLSGSLAMFLFCAVLYGVGIGATQSSLQAMAIVKVSKDRTGAANATFFTGFDGGIGLGAVIAGQLSPLLGYGGMFAAMAAFPLLAGLLYYIGVKHQKV